MEFQCFLKIALWIDRSHGPSEVLARTGWVMLFIIRYIHLFLVAVNNILSLIVTVSQLVYNSPKCICTYRADTLANLIIRQKSETDLKNTWSSFSIVSCPSACLESQRTEISLRMLPERADLRWSQRKMNWKHKNATTERDHLPGERYWE